MTWQSAAIVLALLTVVLVSRRAWRTLRRRRALAGIPVNDAVRQARGVRVAGLLENLPPMKGLNPRRRNMMIGDLVLFADRFVLGSDRGLMADVGPHTGTEFSSVRCTGPGRLVIEGEIGQGLYRFEITVDDAREWFRLLQPFVKEEARASTGKLPWER